MTGFTGCFTGCPPVHLVNPVGFAFFETRSTQEAEKGSNTNSSQTVMSLRKHRGRA
jgi:hypothetical protein